MPRHAFSVVFSHMAMLQPNFTPVIFYTGRVPLVTCSIMKGCDMLFVSQGIVTVCSKIVFHLMHTHETIRHFSY